MSVNPNTFPHIASVVVPVQSVRSSYRSCLLFFLPLCPDPKRVPSIRAGASLLNPKTTMWRMTDFYRKAAPAQIPTPHTHIPDRNGAGPTAPGGTPRSSARSNSDLLSSQSHTTPAPTLFEKAPPVRRTGSLQSISTPRGLTYAARAGERKRVRQTFTPQEKDTWTKRWAPFATTRKQTKYDMFKAKFPSELVPKRSTLFKWAKESVLPRRQLFAETEAGTTQPQLEPENVVAWTGRRGPKPKITEEDERAIIVLVRLKEKHHLPVRACDLQQFALIERGVSISAASMYRLLKRNGISLRATTTTRVVHTA